MLRSHAMQRARLHYLPFLSVAHVCSLRLIRSAAFYAPSPFARLCFLFSPITSGRRRLKLGVRPGSAVFLHLFVRFWSYPWTFHMQDYSQFTHRVCPSLIEHMINYSARIIVTFDLWSSPPGLWVPPCYDAHVDFAGHTLHGTKRCCGVWSTRAFNDSAWESSWRPARRASTKFHSAPQMLSNATSRYHCKLTLPRMASQSVNTRESHNWHTSALVHLPLLTSSGASRIQSKIPILFSSFGVATPQGPSHNNPSLYVTYSYSVPLLCLKTAVSLSLQT